MTQRLNKQQADQWLQDNQVLINAPSCYLSERPYDGRTEVKGRSPSRMGRDQTQIKGHLFHDHPGDGWDDLWFRVSRREIKTRHIKKRNATVYTTRYKSETYPTTRERGRLAPGEKVKPDVSMRPTMERKYYPTPAFNYGLPPEPVGSWMDGHNAKRQALIEMEKGCLRQTTPILGQRVPGHFRYDRRTDYAKQTISLNRTCSIHELMVDDEEPLVFADVRPTNLELIGLEDLWSLLRSLLTAKEMEALVNRYDGVAQPDRNGRYALERAQRKSRVLFQ